MITGHRMLSTALARPDTATAMPMVRNSLRICFLLWSTIRIRISSKSPEMIRVGKTDDMNSLIFLELYPNIGGNASLSDIELKNMMTSVDSIKAANRIISNPLIKLDRNDPEDPGVVTADSFCV